MTREDILTILNEVKDPEIPVLSITDMGIVSEIKIESDLSVSVQVTPTFLGCPAFDLIVKQIKEALNQNGINVKEVVMDKNRTWNSNLISDKGRKILQEFGLTPPTRYEKTFEGSELEKVACPQCGSRNTILRSTFGSTLCRSIHYCYSCHQAFEHFKPL
ncbi:MAG: phenylacetate-CoA oxygenase subunit PaaJ [Bacteroidetes bacterium RIFCSPLOWO2_02_FULL_36_8]|nr:MAG: phenylacetate-CoA oxygenase subunit PaaJ [Bacteroidetes bacterium RIFCSPLOWO2_02_FULL_36_8]OFY68925.1 MAG: phenylacetate-CoA oxygenase subunit PaaJ [Bacteroidetes bacterium RIFCSPLOWO2_12_FULL_37_12]